VISGDVTFSRSAGGGGYGDPLDREANEVATDVAYGYVSERGALETMELSFGRRRSEACASRNTGRSIPRPPARKRARLRQRRKAFTLVQATAVTSVVGAPVLRVARHAPALESRAGPRLRFSARGSAASALGGGRGAVPDASLAVDEPTLEVLNVAFGDRCPVDGCEPRAARSRALPHGRHWLAGHWI